MIAENVKVGCLEREFVLCVDILWSLQINYSKYDYVRNMRCKLIFEASFVSYYYKPDDYAGC
jgi:hypothetical protein